jgi:hypothetical protein
MPSSKRVKPSNFVYKIQVSIIPTVLVSSLCEAWMLMGRERIKIPIYFNLTIILEFGDEQLGEIHSTAARSSFLTGYLGRTELPPLHILLKFEPQICNLPSTERAKKADPQDDKEHAFSSKSICSG